MASFNTQPPEGGWTKGYRWLLKVSCFNTQPPEGGWLVAQIGSDWLNGFNTQPPEGGWIGYRLSRYSQFRFQHTAA